MLCTHDHLDHTDPDTLAQMRGVREFVVPPSSVPILAGVAIPEKRLRTIRRGQTLIIGRAQVSAYPAIHTVDSMGYLIGLDGCGLYITGDSEFGPELEALRDLRPDILFCCINGKWGNMSFEDAVKLALMMQPRLTVPMHYGMFAENTVDPQLFLAAMRERAPQLKAVLLEYNRDYTCQRTGNDVALVLQGQGRG